MRTYRNIAEGIFDRMVLITIRDADNNVNRISHNPALRLNDDAKYRLNYRIHMLAVFNKTMRRIAKGLVEKSTSLIGLLKKKIILK